MSLDIDRRHLLALMGAAALPVSARAADEPDPRMGEIVLGAEDAPVTLIEYASLTCPHCARFHIATWPEFKTNYVDTGKVRFILREAYLDRFGLWASMVARCAGTEAAYPMIDQYLNLQDRWTRVPQNQVQGEIRKIGRLNGLTNKAMDACLGDTNFERALYENYIAQANADNVRATPTFVINGESVSGALSYAEFSAWVDSYL